MKILVALLEGIILSTIITYFWLHLLYPTSNNLGSAEGFANALIIYLIWIVVITSMLIYGIYNQKRLNTPKVTWVDKIILGITFLILAIWIIANMDSVFENFQYLIFKK